MNTKNEVDKSWARWTTVELIVTAAISVAFGLIFMAYSILYVALVPLFGQVGIMVFLGFYYIIGILVPYVVRRPGAAILSSFIAALTELAVGTPFGIAALWAGLVQGAGAEAVFAVSRWRNYRWHTLILAAIVSGIFAFGYEYVLLSYGSLERMVRIGLFLVRIPSAAVLAGLLGKVIGDALARTGVLRSLRISKGH
jgi:energy-coupling factor transport system substrate-specific component